MLQTEPIVEYLKSRLPQAAELEVQNLFRIPGGASRETWSFDARWREGNSEVSRAACDLSACAKEIDRLG